MQRVPMQMSLRPFRCNDERSLLALFLFASFGLTACRPDQAVPSPPDASAGSTTSIGVSLVPLPPTPSVLEDEPVAPLKLLRMTFTSAVEKKEPVDKLQWTSPGQRVYAHLAVRNRSGRTRTITLTFFINGKKRSEVDLDVEPSWSYRTWAYNTIKPGDAGDLELRVTDDSGAQLTVARLPIRKK